MRYAGLSMATTEVAFFLKKQQKTENKNFTRIKPTHLRRWRKPTKTNPVPRNAALSPWGSGLWKQSQPWMHHGTRQKEQEEQSKNLSSLCLTCLCPSLTHPAEPVPVPSPTLWGQVFKCIHINFHKAKQKQQKLNQQQHHLQKKTKVVCLCITVWPNIHPHQHLDHHPNWFPSSFSLYSQ